MLIRPQGKHWDRRGREEPTVLAGFKKVGRVTEKGVRIAKRIKVKLQKKNKRWEKRGKYIELDKRIVQTGKKTRTWTRRGMFWGSKRN